MNPTYWNQDTFTKMTISSTHGLFNYARMLIKFITHFGSSNGGKSLDEPKIYFSFQYKNRFTTSFKTYSKLCFL